MLKKSYINNCKILTIFLFEETDHISFTSSGQVTVVKFYTLVVSAECNDFCSWEQNNRPRYITFTELW